MKQLAGRPNGGPELRIPLSSRPAAVQNEIGTDHEGRFIAGEEKRGIRTFFRRAQTVEDHSLFKTLSHPFGVVAGQEHVFQQFG